MTFWETVERGEYIMIALAVILIIAVCIWWVRAASLASKKKTYPVLMQRVRDHIMEGDTDNAGQICTTASTPGARMICAGIHHIGSALQDVKSSMKDISDLEKNDMSKGQKWLKTFAVISPLLGLVGTLVGVIDRLRDLGEAGNLADTASLCNAIAPTMVTTVAGLGVGIFCLFAFTCLESSIESARKNLDELAVEFIDLLNEPS